MNKSSLSYSQNFTTLIALVTYLAVREGESDAVNAPRLADYLGLNETEVVRVLEHFNGLFRSSRKSYESQDYGKQKNYSLLLRYAHRKYSDGNFESSDPLTNDDLRMLLDFITVQFREEQETERRSRSDLLTLIAASTAAVLSFASIIVSLVN